MNNIRPSTLQAPISNSLDRARHAMIGRRLQRQKRNQRTCEAVVWITACLLAITMGGLWYG